jgi:formyltetrahydrofolate deformylase
MEEKKFILTASCQDAKGIVAEITTKIFHLGGFITSSDQFSDPDTKQFFLRCTFILDTARSQKALYKDLEAIFKKFQMTVTLRSSSERYKLALFTSKQGHCLGDLLSRWKRGDLVVDIPLIISNHETLSEVASWYGIPFYYFPINSQNKEAQEVKIKKLLEEHKVDYIILARYMQILSSSFCDSFKGRIINIHHSFLPSFKGANPYLQAYHRGVKVIGATAHFVTEDLDEGPIISQATIPVTHAHSASDLTRFGADVEALVLAEAVKYASEDRLFVDKNKTIVFK